MANETQPAFDLKSTYVHLEAGGGALPEKVGDDFWVRIADRPYDGMRLVAVIHMTGDAQTWEMHPKGDELLFLLSGTIDLVLREADGERVVELHPGAACVVPSGTWHRQIVRTPGDLLFITPGEGTEHRPL